MIASWHVHPMRLPFAIILTVLLVLAPVRARANDAYVGELATFGILMIVDGVFLTGNMITAIGSSVETTDASPGRGWAIASIILGSLAGLFGVITAGMMLESDLELRSSPIGWSLVGISLASSATNLTLGIVNLARQPPDPHQELSNGPTTSMSFSFAW